MRSEGNSDTTAIELVSLTLLGSRLSHWFAFC